VEDSIPEGFAPPDLPEEPQLTAPGIDMEFLQDAAKSAFSSKHAPCSWGDNPALCCSAQRRVLCIGAQTSWDVVRLPGGEGGSCTPELGSCTWSVTSRDPRP